MWKRTRGQSTVEALLVTFVLLALVFGGFETARAVALKQALDRGAYEAARYIAVHGDPVEAEQVAKEAVSRAILGGDPARVSFATTWYAGIDYGDAFCVTLEYPVTLDMPLVATLSTTLRSEHCTTYEVYP